MHLNRLGFKQDKQTTINEDNQGCIALSKYLTRTKHIDIKHHFIRDQVTANQIDLLYCASHKLAANIIQSQYQKKQFERFRSRMQVTDLAGKTYEQWTVYIRITIIGEWEY